MEKFFIWLIVGLTVGTLVWKSAEKRNMNYKAWGIICGLLCLGGALLSIIGGIIFLIARKPLGANGSIVSLGNDTSSSVRNNNFFIGKSQRRQTAKLDAADYQKCLTGVRLSTFMKQFWGDRHINIQAAGASVDTPRFGKLRWP